MKSRLHYFLALLLASGCLNPPIYLIEPQIEFLSLSRNTVNQLDSVRVEFSFTDGDGDLGKENPDSTDCNSCVFDSCYSTDWNLYLTDLRKGCFDRFMIPYIPSKGSSDAISGKFNLVISGICCLYSDNTGCVPNANVSLDTVLYSIQIKDRAGHLSNILDLPPVIVRCN